MPLYIVAHHTALTDSQKDALAEAITKVHTELFNTPSIFVNVRFQDITQTPCYVGGKRKLTNNITAHVRTGPSRPRSAFDALCTALEREWKGVVSDGDLDTVFVMGAIVAGFEQGLMVPEAGEDGRWMRENMGEFERRAGEGDEGMKSLVEEIKRRGLVA